MSRAQWQRVALLMISIAACCARAQEVNVQAAREGDAVLVVAKANLNADARLAWDVLTAYEHYAEFVPGLKSSRVLLRSGDAAIIEQRGRVGFFPLDFALQVRLAVTETPFERVTSYAISGNVNEMTGTYDLVSEGSTVKLVYRGRIVPAFQLPPIIGLFALRRAVEQQFTALVNEIQRRETRRRQAQQ